MNAPPKENYSIGEVATHTGITVDTIRIWERRYGRPEPVRLPSGHRRYTPEHLRWLRRVAEALALGHRAGHVVRASEEELDAMLSEGFGSQPEDPRTLGLMQLVQAFDGDGIAKSLQHAWRELGPRAFLAELLTPFLSRVGRAWADGDIEVRHERLVSEVVESALRELRARLAVPSRGPRLLLATLSGERHSLGLRMVALACAVRGVHSEVFGTEMPLEQIALAATDIGARAVIVSISLATGGVETDRRLTELRDKLPEGTSLVVGGRGARGVRRGLRGVEYLRDFDQLERWLNTFQNT